MTYPTLDPNPKNHLGKGVFSPAEESEMLAAGYIFARYLPPTKRKPFGSCILCKRPIADAATDGELDSARYRAARAEGYRRTPAPVTA